ncbi:AsnC family transcriptional regulator [Mycobacteroides abscessus subsp. abscessus]|nr:AsnC family transcriptional regulator [Mycobacteroides abscessus subsp. abscessus]
MLLALTQTPRASGVELAQRLGLSRNTVQARLTRWDQHEALAGIDHQIVPRAMGYPMTAYVTARIDQHQLEAIGAALADVPEVVQVHGDDQPATFSISRVLPGRRSPSPCTSWLRSG